jgi:hypothetical protein
MPDPSSGLTRRDFTKAAVAAVAVPVLAPLAACTTTPPESAPAPAPAAPAAPAPTAPDAPASEAPAPPDPLAQALGEAIRVQYGDRMTAEEMEKVRRSIAGTLRTAQRLREFPLPIAAEPAFVYRVPGGTP